MYLIYDIVRLVCAQEEEQQEETTKEENTAKDTNVRSRYRETYELMDNIQDPFSNVVTNYKLILNKNDSLIQPDDAVSVLIGFENTGGKTLTVTDICASLASEYDPSILLRNFSAAHHNISVRGHEVHTFEYTFKVDIKTKPLDYGLLVAVFYRDNSGNEYTSVVMNSTITISELSNKIGTRSFLTLLTLFVTIIAVIVIYRKEIKKYILNTYKRISSGDFSLRKKGTKKVVRSNHVNTGNKERDARINAERDEQDEWLEGSSTMHYIKKKRGKSQRDISQSPKRSPSASQQSRPRGRSTTPASSSK